MSAGYSGTTLAKKLGIKEGNTLLFYNRPDHYWDLFSDVPEHIKELKKVTREEADFIQVFCTSVDELYTQIPIYKTALKKTGMLWVSWAKGVLKYLRILKESL
ncbi:hypothetical protein [uncultured Aquimarina sp.]|uniref:hypothetical protein n=1 Tax=uncultured Aquimarina sp. TaxID=575652 RepID=UPI00262AAA69|nr:hypothetical protein [uncultured Aquimarina sp.]